MIKNNLRYLKSKGDCVDGYNLLPGKVLQRTS